MNVIKSFKALGLMLTNTRVFKPDDFFKNKRVAIVGAADSAFDKEAGDFIEDFDLILRVSKAPHSWSPDKAKFIGSRTDVLFHSFYENEISGGGKIDFELYKKQGIKFVVNPNHNIKGLITHLNYYKRNFQKKRTYLVSRKYHNLITAHFGDVLPTVGYSALISVLNSGCKEIYITGFTFFRTPYANDYRDHFKDMASNKKHLDQQGLHDPELELREFHKQLTKVPSRCNVLLDDALQDIINNYHP